MYDSPPLPVILPSGLTALHVFLRHRSLMRQWPVVFGVRKVDEVVKKFPVYAVTPDAPGTRGILEKSLMCAGSPGRVRRQDFIARLENLRMARER
jgi:hypothetical protein